MGFWPVVNNVIKNSDIVLLVIDARMPELSRNKEVERKIEQFGKKMIVVFNKSDLASSEMIKETKKKHPGAFFISSQKRTGLEILKKKIIELSLEPEPRIGVVGYPNVGKSSLINALVGQRKAIVSPVSGTTRGNQWIRAGDFKIIDSPGVIPLEDREDKLGVISAKDPEKVKNPERIAIGILEIVLSKNKKAAEAHYKIELSDDPYEALIQVGKQRGLLGKGGVVDEHRAAVNIIMDWQRGKLGLK